MHVTSGWANSDGCELFTIGWVAGPPVEEEVVAGGGGPDADGRIERRYGKKAGEEYFDDERFNLPKSFPYQELDKDAPLPGEVKPEPETPPIAARSDTAAGPIYLPDEAKTVIKVYDEHGTLVEDMDPIALIMLMNEHGDT